MLYRLLKVVLLGPLLRVLFRPRTQGRHNIPPEGPAILAANHLSFADTLLMPLMVPRRPVIFIGKAEYFTGRGLKGRLVAAFFRAVGTIPVDRTSGRGALAALHTGQRVLKEGNLLGIFPEGTRSPDGRLYRGRTGVARLALDANAPVIPCALVNTDKIKPPSGKIVPRLTRVEVRFGEPLDFSRYAGMESNQAVLRAITAEIMYTLMQLSGQDYVDTYATKVKTTPEQPDTHDAEAA